MSLFVMAGFSHERFPQAMTHRQAPASKTVHHLLYVLDLRRRSKAMADAPSPLVFTQDRKSFSGQPPLADSRQWVERTRGNSYRVQV